MPVEIRVPPLGESLVDAVVGQWLKSEGDAVSRGETVVELETDKVNLDVTAEDDGVLMGFTHHRATEHSTLTILDAQSLESVASVAIPARIPYGFHGNWIPSQGEGQAAPPWTLEASDHLLGEVLVETDVGLVDAPFHA